MAHALAIAHVSSSFFIQSCACCKGQLGARNKTRNYTTYYVFIIRNTQQHDLMDLTERTNDIACLSLSHNIDTWLMVSMLCRNDL